MSQPVVKSPTIIATFFISGSMGPGFPMWTADTMEDAITFGKRIAVDKELSRQISMSFCDCGRCHAYTHDFEEVDLVREDSIDDKLVKLGHEFWLVKSKNDRRTLGFVHFSPSTHLISTDRVN